MSPKMVARGEAGAGFHQPLLDLLYHGNRERIFMSRKMLLLNWVYYHPVGHAVEAFKVAKGLASANEDVAIHLMLNSRTAVELSDGCDWIERTYAINVNEVAREGHEAVCLRGIPGDWDYIVSDHRPTCSPFPFEQSLRTFHDLAAERFHASLWRGAQNELPSPNFLQYRRNATIRMQVPEEARAFVRTLPLSSLNVVLIPGGSSPEPVYPTLDSWRNVLRALQDEFPSAHFFITGRSATDDRSSTMGFPCNVVESLALTSRNVFNCYDIGIWNQVALIERSDILIAPHTGFAFLAPSVGTPWLAVSGVRWPECYFNEVPFYSVLPICRHYPCWAGMRAGCEEQLAAGETVPCMAAEMDGRIHDLVNGAHLLLSRNFSFDQAMTLYRLRIKQMGLAEERFFQID